MADLLSFDGPSGGIDLSKTDDDFQEHAEVASRDYHIDPRLGWFFHLSCWACELIIS